MLFCFNKLWEEQLFPEYSSYLTLVGQTTSRIYFKVILVYKKKKN